MKIGIISDTHDNLPKVEAAVKLFNRRKVNLVLHAGDYVAPFTVARLNKLSCDWLGVFGNNDGERQGLLKASGGRIKEGPLRIELANKRITLIHDINSINPPQEKADIIIFGHSHKEEIIRESGRLLINPGECSGWLTEKATVAILDLDTLSVKTFKI